MNVANHFGYTNYDNKKIIVAILYLKVLLDKKHFQKFYTELNEIIKKYSRDFHTVQFSNILNIMSIDLSELKKLK